MDFTSFVVIVVVVCTQGWFFPIHPLKPLVLYWKLSDFLFLYPTEPKDFLSHLSLVIEMEF